MKIKSIVASCVVLFSAAATAGNLPPKPAHCPSVSALKSVGVNAAIKMEDNWIALQASNHFGTPENWFFGIATGAENAKDAISSGNSKIGTLQLQGEPEELDAHNGWGCIYMSESAIGVAVTPPEAVPTSTFSRLMKNSSH